MIASASKGTLVVCPSYYKALPTHLLFQSWKNFNLVIETLITLHSEMKCHGLVVVVKCIEYVIQY